MQNRIARFNGAHAASRLSALVAGVSISILFPAVAGTASAGEPPAADVQPVAAETSVDDLTRRLEALEQAQGERELEELRRAAESEAAVAPPATSPAQGTVFTSGDRSLQALNPEISVTADAGAHLAMSGREPKSLESGSGFDFRVVGLHIQANLDPYSFAKFAIPVTPEGVELEEAYATWTAVLPNLSLTLGRFRQDFGVINRWHEEALDQYDFPLALTTLLGEEGLNAIGVSLGYRLPALWAHSQELTVQITNGMNEQLFSGRTVGIPTALARLRNYWDLSPDLYLELGLTGMWGSNHDAPAAEGEEAAEPVVDLSQRRDTLLGGLDLNLSWSPAQRAHYRGVTWRSELYAVQKQTPEGRLRALGGYSYLDLLLSDSWSAGVRGDLTQPFELDNGGEWSWGVSPYVTWKQSEWVKLRLQGTHLRPQQGDSETRLTLQAVMSVGPHKHAKY